MKIIRLLCIALVFLQFSCKGQTKKINGVSFVAAPNKVQSQHITPVQKVSANYVTLMPFGFIRNLSSPEIIHNTKRQWFGETAKGIEQYAKAFQQQKIKIMIKPQIWVWHGEYTGHITMDSEANWKKLESSYTSFILTYAKVAQQLNAEIFCIGTELEKFVANRPSYWKNLIKKIKKVYHGKLTYAANWDEFKRVRFWDQIDFIGIDAYFPLSPEKTPSIAQLEKGWLPHKKQIQHIQQRFQKPILFTEYGYRSVDYTAKEPWKSDRFKGKINVLAQKNALQALYNQFWNEPWFAGGFIWKWFLNHEKSGGATNNQFTPQNKETEVLLQELYRQN